MSKNLLEELNFVIYKKIDFKPFLIKVLVNHEKRLTELEKDKNNILEHHEINETGGVNNIKIILNDPKLKKGD